MAGRQVQDMMELMDPPIEADATFGVRFEGFAELSLDEQRPLLQAVRYLSVLSNLFSNRMLKLDASGLAAWGNRSRESYRSSVARRGSGFTTPPESFTMPPLTTKQLQDLVNADATESWGPQASTDEEENGVSELMAPRVLALCVWLGTKLSKPIVAFLYSLSSDDCAWESMWAHHEFVLNDAPFALSEAVAEVHGRKFTTTAEGVLHFAACAIERIRSVYEAMIRALGKATGYHSPAPDRIEPHEFAGVEAKFVQVMRRDAIQVCSKLPAGSSVNTQTNFLPSRHNQWFKTAEYHFDKVYLPFQALDAGDVMSELKWHRFATEVLRKRASCLDLSERQVIEHLSRPVHKNTMLHHVVATCLSRDEATVSDWLDAIRDFYFPNGQFRFYVEQGWVQLRVGSLPEFNDLIHHIRTYYQLVFVDYAAMRGKMTRHDFARHLFDKLQHLLTECTSTLSKIVKKFFPLGELLDMFSTHMEQSHLAASGSEQDADMFITWCIERLQRAKTSANSANLYKATATALTSNIDFASVPKPRSDRTMQTTSLISHQTSFAARGRGRGRSRGRGHGRGSFSVRPSMQSQSSYPSVHQPVHQSASAPPAIRPPPSRQHLRIPVPNLKPARECTVHEKRAVVEQAKLSAPPDLVARFCHEETGPPGTRLSDLCIVMKAHGHAKWLPTTPPDVNYMLLHSYSFHTHSMCALCPSNSSTDRLHSLRDCPHRKRLLPDSSPAWQQFAAHPANQDVGLRVFPTMKERNGTADLPKEARRWDRPASDNAPRKFPRVASTSNNSHVR
jgi:hypothetical protein